MRLHEPTAAYYARINPPPLLKATMRMVHAIRGACAKGKAKFMCTAAKFKSKSSAAATSPAIKEGRVRWESWVTESFYSDY